MENMVIDIEVLSGIKYFVFICQEVIVLQRYCKRKLCIISGALLFENASFGNSQNLCYIKANTDGHLLNFIKRP